MKEKFFGLVKKIQSFFRQNKNYNKTDDLVYQNNTIVHMNNYREEEFKPVDLSVIIEEMNETSYDLKERYEYFQNYIKKAEEKIEHIPPEIENKMYPDMPNIIDLGLFRHLKTSFPAVLNQLFPEINSENIQDYLNEAITLLPMILKNKKDASYNDCMAYIMAYFNLFLKFQHKREPARKYLYLALQEVSDDNDKLTKQTIETVAYFKIMLDQNYFVNKRP